MTGTAKISSKLSRGWRPASYVNVHTGKNPAGEIRGQAKVTGEKSTKCAPRQVTRRAPVNCPRHHPWRLSMRTRAPVCGAWMKRPWPA
jgi:hypothetical protein